MATVTKGRTFVSGEVVTPTKLNALVDSATVTQIVDADVSASAGIVDTKLATISTAGKVSNSATTATNLNTASAIVARDASGNFSAGTITAALSGNASTATTLQTARTIAISGDVTGTATSFNGSANIAIASAITADSIVNADINSAAGIADTMLATISTAGKVANSATTATSTNTANAIVARDVNGGFSAGTITATTVSVGAFAGTGATLLVPTGAVMPFAMNSAPSGWLAADGSTVSRSTYSALWTALGTTSSPYGQGDGSTTFNLPDLRGYFVRGAGTNSDGTAAGTFGAKQADDLKSHTHEVDMSGSNGPMAAGPAGNGPAARYSTTGTTGATGGTETRPRNIAMLYCIKF